MGAAHPFFIFIISNKCIMVVNGLYRGFVAYILIRSEISRFNIYNSQAIINISPAISLTHFEYEKKYRASEKNYKLYSKNK